MRNKSDTVTCENTDNARVFLHFHHPLLGTLPPLECFSFHAHDIIIIIIIIIIIMWVFQCNVLLPYNCCLWSSIVCYFKLVFINLILFVEIFV